MMSLRLFPLVLMTIAGCAGPMTDPSRSRQRPESDAVFISPGTAFANCIPLAVSAEIVDYTVPAEQAEPKTRITRMVAEYPATPIERQTGLQNRNNLHPMTAMLFDFDGRHNPVLWMKDTPASLDMVFFDKSGDVFHIETGTTPNSTAFITPDEPEPVASYVLELPAGRAEALGIFPGTTQVTVGAPATCASFFATS